MSIYDNLNPEQREAVYTTQGPLLMLAGAGTGKTRSIMHRIVYLIEEEGVKPWNILAITFTNKAANEMKERAAALVGEGSEEVWISTFHSTCSKILRRNIDMIGYDRNFTIYDASDQKTLMKEVLKSMNIDPKQFPERSVLAEISSAKDECKTPAMYREEYGYEFRKAKIADIYAEYQKRLRANNALDFDDLLTLTVELFEKCPQVLEYYQDRFHYIMVDEYQDTNTVQFKLVSMLAAKYRNLCVVGDDDQSIYKFRGANIYNILNFEKVYPDARVIRLEQNYRSTKNILDAANGVIVNNEGRKAKKLWTENDQGEPVHFKQYDSEYDEAEGVVRQIRFLAMRGIPYQDMAILYRTNAQSRVFEEKLKQQAIPYAIVKGTGFYDRKEIKDLMAYLRVIDSGVDDISAKRIINVPKRGIGATTVDRVAVYAEEQGIGFMDAVYEAEYIPELGRSAGKIRKFGELIEEFKDYAGENTLCDLMNHILEETEYRKELELENTDDSRSRLMDIDELINDIVYFEDHNELPSLRAFLEEKDMYTLNAGIDNLEDTDNKVLLMTMHNAKGLEFENVFLGGMEDGVFPGFMSIMSGDKTDIEEERRLCYVGITRAKKRLFMSAAARRMTNGRAQYNPVSRFMKEIPPCYLDADCSALRKPESRIREDDGGYSYSESTYGGSSYSRSIPSKKHSSGTGDLYGLEKFKGVPKAKADYQVGDTVKHIKFGRGTVTEMVNVDSDVQVTVEFERVGRKKMLASFAKLKKL